jgi:hypothetical protein
MRSSPRAAAIETSGAAAAHDSFNDAAADLARETEQLYGR